MGSYVVNLQTHGLVMEGCLVSQLADLADANSLSGLGTGAWNALGAYVNVLIHVSHSHMLIKTSMYAIHTDTSSYSSSESSLSTYSTPSRSINPPPIPEKQVASEYFGINCKAQVT